MAEKVKKIEKKRSLSEQIEKAVKGLFYLSETDAELTTFTGAKADEVTAETLRQYLKIDEKLAVEEITFDAFFSRLTKINDWYGDKEKENAERFGRLKKLLEQNLKDLKVFRFGTVRIVICITGIDVHGILTGVKTEAVET